MILLDLMLLGKSGEELLPMIIEQSDVRVIIISAKEEQLTKVSMLRSGAEDYITKPFDTEEVAARIDTQLRRYRRTEESTTPVFKDISLDTNMKQATVNGQILLLTAREYNILKLFLDFPRKMFTKENIV